MKKLLGALLVCAMVLTGCGSQSGGGDQLSVYHDYETANREVTSFNYLGDYQAINLQVVTNFVDGLVEHDENGKLINALAESYEKNEDATVWTFKLKDGIKWLKRDGSEYADVKAEDFVTAVKYTLTAANKSSNIPMVTSFIKGAEEYYKASDEGTATDELFENVGVKALDDKTIEFTMVASKPYFDTALTYGCFYPVNADFLKEVGETAFGSDPDKILYNGCYLMKEFTKDSYKEYVRNEKYWDVKNVPFETVQVTIIESLSRAYDMFATGELDRAVLTPENIMVLNKEGSEYYDNLVETPAGPYSYVIWFNHEQAGNPDWNAATNNINFRKAWYYGINPTEYQKRTNPINPSALNNNTYTASGLVSTSDGTDYTKLDELKAFNGDGITQYQPEKAAEYKAKAMEELSAQGVTFPIKVSYPYQNGNQTSEETFQVVKGSFEESLGSDFIVVEGLPYIKSATSELYSKNLQSIQISGWGADYGDPQNYLVQLTQEGTMNQNYIHFTDNELDKMVAEADKILDLDTRYHEFAKIEAYVLENAYVVPIMVDGHQVELTKVNDYSKPNAKYGMASKKIKYWETKNEPYTKAEYEEAAKK